MFRLEIPAKEELLIVMTHNSNESFLRLCKNYIPDNVEVLNLAELSARKCDGQIMVKSLLERFRDKMKENSSYKLITFVMDFNSGYSGYNLSPIADFIATLETEGTLTEVYNIMNLGEGDASPVNDYAFVKNQTELNAITLKNNKIPFRIFTTGGGGPSVSAYYNNLVSLTADEARAAYNFNAWSYNKFMGSFRTAEGSPVSINSALSQSPGSPGTNYRRLPILTKPSSRNNSASWSTSSNCSAGSLNSPTCQESPISGGTAASSGRANSENTLAQLQSNNMGSSMESVGISVANFVPDRVSSMGFFGDANFLLPEQTGLNLIPAGTRISPAPLLSINPEAETADSAPQFKK